MVYIISVILLAIIVQSKSDSKSDNKFKINLSKNDDYCESLNNDKCDWKNIIKKYNYNFPSHVFKRENNDIQCYNKGMWSKHSRSPCDIGEYGNAGIEYIHMKYCQLSLKDENKLYCSITIHLYDETIQTRIKYSNGLLSCKCDNTKDKQIECCKWKISAEFKTGQEDLSQTQILFNTIIVLVLFTLIIMINMMIMYYEFY